MEMKPFNPKAVFPEPNEESFWTTFKTISKISSVMLPAVGASLGPAGILLGTAVGGILGSLAESVQMESKTASVSFEEPTPTAMDSSIERAHLAEATLESIIRLGQSAQSHEVFAKIQKIWSNHPFQQNDDLIRFITPAIRDYGYRTMSHHWLKRVQFNPQVSNDTDSLKPESTPIGSQKAEFYEAIFKEDTRLVDGIPKDGEESLAKWFQPLISRAVFAAKALATDVAKSHLNAIVDLLKKERTESLPANDQLDFPIRILLQRTVMADCALQAVELMDEKQLQELNLSPNDDGREEGIIDFIKTGVQKIGPVALKYAKEAVKKYVPVLVEELKKKLDGNRKQTEGKRTKVMAKCAYNPINSNTYLFEDENPDRPVIEPQPPVSPVG
jgi:hypothetical protein